MKTKQLIRIYIPAAVLVVVLLVPSNGHYANESRWEEWPEVLTASAKIGNRELGVYSDPHNPSHILIYPEYWIVRRDTKVVLSPNGTFKLEGGVLYFDRTWRDEKGLVTGVEWGSPKMSTISFFSRLFRKPRFGKDSVSIWNGSLWIKVEGLPVLEMKGRQK